MKGLHSFRTHGSRATVAMIVGVLSFSVLFLVALWAAAVSLVRADRAAVIQKAIAINDTAAIAAEQYTVRTLESVDAVLKFYIREYSRVGRNIDVETFIAESGVDVKTFNGMLLSDKNGKVLQAAHKGKSLESISIADREHFLVHVAADSKALFIGKPVVGRVSGMYGIPLSRRINNADGSFGGVAVLLIDPSRFSEVFQFARWGSGDTATLVGLDGIVRGHLAGDKQSAGQDVRKSPVFALRAKQPNGNFFAKGQIDQIEKYYSYRALAKFQLIVIIGSAKSDVLADYYVREKRYFWGASAASAAIIISAGLLISFLIAQRRTVAAIASSEAKYLATFNQAAVGIAHSDIDGRYSAVNQRFCEILGYSRAELLALTYVDVTHRDDLAESIQARKQISLSGGAEHSVPKEIRYVRKDGSIALCLWSACLVSNVVGSRDYLLIVLQDIASLKQTEVARNAAEAMFRSMFEQAGIGIALVAVEGGRILRWNAALATMLGYAVADLSVLTVHDVAEPIDDAHFQHQWQAVLDGQCSRYQVEKRYRRKDGSAMWGFLTSTLVRNTDDQPQFFIDMVEDISARKTAEEAVGVRTIRLQQLSRQLMRAEEEERRRLGRELHDLTGSNLSALLLNIELIRSLLPPSETQVHSARFDDTTALLRETIGHMRGVLADLRPPALDELGLLAALEHYAGQMARRSGSVIRVKGCDPSPRLPTETEIALFRIAQEALANALRHGHAANIDITLATKNGATVFTLSDDGVGFDPEALKPGSTSLGMTTMRERAEAIDGELTIDSSPDKGVRISVFLN